MTDNDIVKALECCAGDDGCDVCPMYKPSSECITELQGKALDLINRQKAELQKAKAELKETTEKFNCQQYVYADLSDIIKDKNAEIEKLQADYSSMQSTLAKMSMGVAEAKAEAIKEFAEKVKATQRELFNNIYSTTAWNAVIDNLVEEMVGEG